VRFLLESPKIVRTFTAKLKIKVMINKIHTSERVYTVTFIKPVAEIGGYEVNEFEDMDIIMDMSLINLMLPMRQHLLKLQLLYLKV